MADLNLNEEYGLEFLNGDFALVIGDDEILQRGELIILSNQGEWKEFPLVGCDLVQMMKSKGKESEIKRKVRLQLISDGIDYSTIKSKIEISQ